MCFIPLCFISSSYVFIFAPNVISGSSNSNSKFVFGSTLIRLILPTNDSWSRVETSLPLTFIILLFTKTPALNAGEFSVTSSIICSPLILIPYPSTPVKVTFFGKLISFFLEGW